MSRCFIAIALFAAYTLVTDLSHAQGVTQTVQLPTFHVTGVSTSVIVPDRGSVYLGGVNRSSIGGSQFGSPLLPGLGGRAVGRSSVAGGMSIQATIIDHDEIDRALLAEAARRRGARVDVYGRPVADAARIPRDVVGRRWASGFDRYGTRRSAMPTPY